MEITPITPITVLRVCSGVPLDRSYTDTITFGSAASQASYFAGKTKYSWSNMTPVRINNVIRVPVNQDNLFDCNYVAFQNANFGSKWLYAFITNIQYINPNMSEITIELDVFQTWMFQYTVKECMVIREHANTDNYGDNTLIEPLEVGEYVDEQSYRTGHMVDYDAVIMYAQQDGLGAGTVGGIFTGLSYEHAPLSGSGGAMLDLLQSLANTNRADSVVASYIMPSDFYTEDKDVVEITLTVPKEVTSLGSYTPRNKKLLSYPYNMLMVSNSMGSTKTYRYEYFYNLGSSAIFIMSCPMGVNPEVIIYPRSYDQQRENFHEAMSLGGFPQFGYVMDTYRAWMAQSGNSFALNAFGNVANFGISALTGNVPGALSSGMGIANNVASIIDHQSQSNRGAGSQGSNALVALKAKDFYFMQHHIREDYARVLDDYFDMYGYLTNRVKVPNITGRPSWNYVKTEDAKVVGKIPFEDIVTIKNALNNGITFWHGDYVGDYSRNNGV